MDHIIQEAARIHAANPTDDQALHRLLTLQARAGDAKAGRQLRSLQGEAPSFLSHLVESERFGRDYRMTLGIKFGESDVSISIQAGASHYCSPRTLLPYAQYDEFEIGFQRSILPASVEEWMGEYWEIPTDDWTVAGYVPVEIVQRLFDYLFVEYGEPQSVKRE